MGFFSCACTEVVCNLFLFYLSRCVCLLLPQSLSHSHIDTTATKLHACMRRWRRPNWKRIHLKNIECQFSSHQIVECVCECTKRNAVVVIHSLEYGNVVHRSSNVLFNLPSIYCNFRKFTFSLNSRTHTHRLSIPFRSHIADGSRRMCRIRYVVVCRRHYVAKCI